VRKLSQLYAMTMLFLRPVLRQPMLTVVVSVIPVSFILIFRLIGGKELSLHALYGTLVVFAANVGIISLPQVAVTFQSYRLRDMFVASPVSPLLYAAGMGLSRLCWAAPGLGLIILFLTLRGGLRWQQVPWVLLVIFFTWFTGVMIGFFISTFLPDPFMIGNASNLVGMLLSVLPPIYYPLSLVPAPWRWLPMLVPTTHAAQLIRAAGGLAVLSRGASVLHWSILCAYAVLCGLLSIRYAQWRES